MNTLIISNTPIHQDAAGRYSLNDLHRAAGEAKNRQPARFINRPETMAWIQRLDAYTGAKACSGTSAVASRQKLGTYACEELMRAYAEWIGPALHQEVHRALDALGTEPDQPRPATESASTHDSIEKAAFTRKQYERRCATPRLEDILNGLYELDLPLTWERRALAEHIHITWYSDAVLGVMIRHLWLGTDAKLGAFIRAWLKKDFLEVSEIEAQEEMERRSGQSEDIADNACNAPVGEAA
jgi:hypothetical protein